MAVAHPTERLGPRKVRARSDSDKQAKASAILAAAEGLMRPGAPLPSAAEIAAAANVAKGTVYVYFGSKEEVFLGLQQWYLGQWANRTIEELQKDTSPLKADDVTAAFLSYPLAGLNAMRLAAMTSSVLEANVGREATIRFKSLQRDALGRMGLAVAMRAPKVTSEAASACFLRSFGYLVGIWQLAEPPAVCREALLLPELGSLNVDFRTEAETGLRAFWQMLL